MRISVLGCGGGRAQGSRPTAFLIDRKLLLDAGTATEALGIKECARIGQVLITHAHIDHIGDLPFLAEMDFDLREEPVVLYGIKEVIENISSHIFNWRIWPNFFEIPDAKEAKLSYKTIKPLESIKVNSYNVLPIPVNHVVPTVGYLIDDGKTALAFAADTYIPIDTFWEKIRGEERLRAVIIEASFPNRMEELAKITGHLTPNLMAREVKKLGRRDVEIYISHIKPLYREEVVIELRNLSEKLPLKVLEDGMEINL